MWLKNIAEFKCHCRTSKKNTIFIDFQQMDFLLSAFYLTKPSLSLSLSVMYSTVQFVTFLILYVLWPRGFIGGNIYIMPIRLIHQCIDSLKITNVRTKDLLHQGQQRANKSPLQTGHVLKILSVSEITCTNDRHMYLISVWSIFQQHNNSIYKDFINHV